MIRRIIATIKDSNGVWQEHYLEGVKNFLPMGHEDPESWLREMVNDFNLGLRPGELPREFVSMSVEEVEPEELDEDDFDEDDEDEEEPDEDEEC